MDLLHIHVFDSNYVLPNQRGYTPLHVACMAGKATVAEFLLRNGADASILNNVGAIIFSVLMYMS